VKGYFVCGIDTAVGKTLVSAVLVEAGKTDYWKPIQAGLDEKTDTQDIQECVYEYGKMWPERFRLRLPASPHHAAAEEGLRIGSQHFDSPPTEDTIIIEGCGGLLVPLNQEETMLDLVKKFKLPVILVSKFYLGSINHTLMSVEVLKSHGVALRGIIFNGEMNEASEKVILQHTGVEKLGYIPQLEKIDTPIIKNIAPQFQYLFDELETN